METRYLRSFLKIADTGSISRAAEALSISQPSLSQQLLRLEDEVGVSLFARTARGVTLTDAGRVFAEHARQLLRGVDRAVEDIRDLDGDAVGTVILALPFSISKLAGVALFEAMKRKAPLLNFRLVEAMTGQIWGWIEEGKVDLGILNDLGPRRNLSFHRIASEEIFLVGPKGALGDNDEIAVVSASSLSGLPMILPGLPHGLRQLLDYEMARRGVTLNVDRDLDALSHIGALIAGDHGFSLLPRSAIEDSLAAGTVSIARIDDGALRRTLSLVRNSGELVTHASVRCEDIVMDVLATLIETGTWHAQPESTVR